MNTHLLISENTATLVFNRENSPRNFIDLPTLQEISTHLDQLSNHPHLTALIILSSKTDSFLEGFDPDQLLLSSNESFTHLTSTAQSIFNRIADLPIPSIAAIHGACLGAGFELALACHWRIASESVTTKIGLPQTSYGLIPSCGGSTRLPNLIGLQDSLPIILSGKIHSPSQAKTTGLIDETTPTETLEAFAHSYIRKGQRILNQNPITHNQAVAKLIQIQTQKDLLKKYQNQHPATSTALEVASASIGRTRQQSQLDELQAASNLFALPQTKQLLRLQILKQNAKHPPSSQTHRASIIGANPTTSHLAFCLSSNSIHTTFIDLSIASLASAMSSISSSYNDAINQTTITPHQASRSLDRIHPSSSATPLHLSEIIFTTSHQALTEITHSIPHNTIIAFLSNPEPIHQLASSFPHPERLIGLHFFQPTQQIEAVEVIHTHSTSQLTISKTISLIRQINKIPILVHDSPGFLINRILIPYLIKAVELFEQGGDPNEIDNSMIDFGMKIGPLRFIDELGLKHILEIAQTISTQLHNSFEIPQILRKLIASGHTGIKDGSGFFVYDTPIPAVNAEAIGMQTDTEPIPPNTSSILSKIISQQANLCLENNIAQSPDDIDLAMILIAGYPATLGGPITHSKNSSKPTNP